MMQITRYEKGLQIALKRMGMWGVAYINGIDVAATLFDYDKYRPQAQEVYRLVNLIEELERQAGVQHVRVVRKEASALTRLEALGYEVKVLPEVGPRDGEASWIAMAFYEGRLVAHAYGDTKAEALQGLLGEVGA